MQKVFELAKNLGRNRVYLFVSTENSKAIGFYTKLGFEVCRIFNDRCGKGKHSLIMRKKLCKIE